MKFCSNCEKYMSRDIIGGMLWFQCMACGEKLEGDDWDCRIGGEMLRSAETAEKFFTLINKSSFDAINLKVMRDCKKCGLDYMTQVRVSEREIIIWTCTCGNIEQNE